MGSSSSSSLSDLPSDEFSLLPKIPTSDLGELRVLALVMALGLVLGEDGNVVFTSRLKYSRLATLVARPSFSSRKLLVVAMSISTLEWRDLLYSMISWWLLDKFW